MARDLALLGPDEVDAALVALGGWSVEGGKLTRRYEFAAFRDAFDDWCRGNAVVSEFVRFHPLLETRLPMAHHLATDTEPRVHAVAFDYRGHGDTPRPDGPVDWQRYGDDAEATVDAWTSEPPASGSSRSRHASMATRSRPASAARSPIFDTTSRRLSSIRSSLRLRSVVRPLTPEPQRVNTPTCGRNPRSEPLVYERPRGGRTTDRTHGPRRSEPCHRPRRPQGRAP